MKLINYFNMFTDDDIVDRLLALYPKEEFKRDKYINALEVLRSLDVDDEEPEFKIQVELNEDDFADNYQCQATISGYHAQHGGDFSIDFLPWEKWLAMEITNKSIKNLGEIDCLAHILWEMTWTGYNSDTSDDMDAISDRIYEIENGIVLDDDFLDKSIEDF